MSEITDKTKLESIVDNLYISPQQYESIEATELEMLFMSQLQRFKTWADKQIKNLPERTV